MVDIEEEDFLENDAQIRGQNYCLLSFISPEKVLNNKNMFYLEHFLKHVAPDCNLNADKIYEKYLDFMYTREENLSNEFNKQNDFRTSVRGIKVRGVYDSLNEAQIKAKRLQSKDKNFHVFVGQIGYWLPWDPQADYIDNQEFMNAELNKLMKEYKTNSEHKDILYEELKTEKIAKIKEENKEIKTNNEEKYGKPEPEEPEPEPESKESEPEPESKESEPEPEPKESEPEPESKESEPEPEPKESDKEPQAIFGDDDAWVQQKLRKPVNSKTL